MDIRKQLRPLLDRLNREIAELTRQRDTILTALTPSKVVSIATGTGKKKVPTSSKASATEAQRKRWAEAKRKQRATAKKQKGTK